MRSQPGIVFKSILTTGDSVGSYRMVGIPDGLGRTALTGRGLFVVDISHI